MQVDCSHQYINIYKKHHFICVPRGHRLFENEDEDDDFITESNFDKDEDFFIYILVYILVELIINIFSTLLSISSMN